MGKKPRSPRGFVPAVGSRCTVWLNGHRIATDLDTATHGPALTLDRSLLQTGVNRIQIVVTMETNSPRLPERNDLGTVRVRGAAPAPTGALFNGLAQVIVERTDPTVPLRLTAQADSLVPAALSLP